MAAPGMLGFACEKTIISTGKNIFSGKCENKKRNSNNKKNPSNFELEKSLEIISFKILIFVVEKNGSQRN